MSTWVAPTPWQRDAGVIGLVSMCHASSHFSHLLLPLMFPFFIRDLGLSYVGLGGVMSVFFAVSFCAQTLSGFLVDRHGARKVLYVAQGLMALACVWLSQAHSLSDLMLGSVMLGLGNGVYHPVDYSVLNRQVSPTRLGHAYSMHSLSGTLGWSLAPPFMVGISIHSIGNPFSSRTRAPDAPGSTPISRFILLLRVLGSVHFVEPVLFVFVAVLENVQRPVGKVAIGIEHHSNEVTIVEKVEDVDGRANLSRENGSRLLPVQPCGKECRFGCPEVHLVTSLSVKVGHRCRMNRNGLVCFPSGVRSLVQTFLLSA